MGNGLIFKSCHLYNLDMTAEILIIAGGRVWVLFFCKKTKLDRKKEIKKMECLWQF